ncbi:MAG: L-histidine N(alpha)-methyltransferase [Magnetospirillum sp.]|nr:L-histidine N(alpha)-methyltransferase [Magnetospirillum sp.]
MTNPEFRAALLTGLVRRPRRIPCRFLYDAVGSELFERITELDGYYLTRAENALLSAAVGAVAAMVGPGARVVEPGPGAMLKTRLLIAALDRPAAYAPIDVAEGIVPAASALADEFPGLFRAPVVADFTRSFRLPALPGAGPILVFFPGSTIGNLAPPQAVRFLARMAGWAGRDGWVLVGVDPVRDPARLRAAYDDPQGVTAAFMRNLLVRANRELGAGFDVQAFDHHVRWNPAESRVEHRLVCRREQSARVAGRTFRIRRGETIHTENCHKYPPDEFHRLAERAGLRPTTTWLHADGLFSLHLMQPSGGPQY